MFSDVRLSKFLYGIKKIFIPRKNYIIRACRKINIAFLYHSKYKTEFHRDMRKKQSKT